MTTDRMSPPTALTMASPPPPSTRRWSPRGARESIQPVAPPEPPPPPRGSRSGGLLAKLSAFLTFLVFAGFLGAGAVIYGKSMMNDPGPLQQDKVVFIPRNTGASEIATLLQQEGVINSALMFEVAHFLSGGRSLKAGEYQFKQQASLSDVRDVLTEGRSIQHSITLPEGLTSEQIVGRLMENDVLVGEVRTIPREGALLPDTYRFERGTTREQLLSRMEQAQRRALQEIWSRRSPDIPIRSPNDLVILASIVEKETGRSDERTRVASVFINRLNRGMRLESDPTIIYGLVGGKGSLGRGILATEIRQPTPYNTYVINGLPPGPIANPGRASLEATANPSRTRDLFFVADGTGGHAFAETYEQHQRNVARWRQIERGGAAESPPAPAAPAAQPRPPGQRSEGPMQPALGAPLSPSQAASQAGPGQTPDIPASASAFAIPRAALEVFGPVGDPASRPTESDLPAASPGGIESYPVAPGRRQSMQRAAAATGAGGPLVDGDAPPTLGQTEARAAAAPARSSRPRGFDAVEGTRLDPLNNRTFDLSHPKTVPALR